MQDKKKYVCVMFPYPSGKAHVGHWYNYAITDSYCRYLRHTGVEVFQPFGYDAFGLPAENAARKLGKDPREITYDNIKVFRGEMNRMNTGFQDLLVTSDPSYYKWTQWLFLKLKEHGLAYKKMGEVNWCPSCATVLAREQVKNGNCDRCDSLVQTKELEQWYFRITAYTERLINDLNGLDYPAETIAAQRNWLANQHDWCVSRQRPWGCPIPIEGETDTLDTFVDSSFYYVRYCDPNNENELCAKDKYRQVDLYVGGSEHACMHLVYTRFIHMFLYDIGIVSTQRPFKKLIHQGMILMNGEKMSKSKGNVVEPDKYNSGHLKMYLMFIAHYFDGGSWSDSHFKGIERFDKKLQIWFNNSSDDGQVISIEEFKAKIFAYMESFKFNKVISEWMTFYNKNKNTVLNNATKNELKKLYNIINPD